MKKENNEMVWKEGDAVVAQSFIGYVQIISDKMATSLKCTAQVAYRVYAVLMNLPYLFGLWLIETVHTVVMHLDLKSTTAKEAARVLSEG